MSFGFVTTAGGRNGHLVAELSVQAGKETILVYKENPNRAFAQRSVSFGSVSCAHTSSVHVLLVV